MQKFKVDKVVFVIMIGLLSCILLGMFYPVFNYGMPILSIVASLYLWKLAPKMVAKDAESKKVQTYRQLAIFSIVFIVCYMMLRAYEAMNILTLEQVEILHTARYFLFFLLIMFVGNLSPKLPFNRTIGLRLPWTIANEDTWRYAHLILGYTSIPCLCIMFIAYLVQEQDKGLMLSILLWCVLPAVLSFIYDKRKGDHHEF